MSLHNDAKRGQDAAEVLANPAYVDGMATLRASIVDKWKACPIRDKEGQTLLLQTMRLADSFEQVLQGMIEQGKFAQHKLEIDKIRNESPMRQAMRRVL